MENFEILNKLGNGSYSTVYKVRRKIDGQIYALKKVNLSNLTEKEKANSLNEVRILASIKSKYVISYKEAFFDEKDKTLGIVMEYADNGDLFQKILFHKKNKTFFEETDIWKILIQLVKGLKSLHDLKILHRDLKSANVFLFTNKNAKLGDLNVSKVARRGLGYTQTGTPYYASPEVWKDLPYNNKSDIWSLGCVLYEIITLNPPFKAKNMENLYKKVIRGDVNKIPNIFSDDLYKMVLFLLQVNPDKRPSCDEILNNVLIKKRIEYFQTLESEEVSEINNENSDLLKTIHCPKNLIFLGNQLPKANYVTNTHQVFGDVKNLIKNKSSYMTIQHELNLNNNLNIKNDNKNNSKKDILPNININNHINNEAVEKCDKTNLTIKQNINSSNTNPSMNVTNETNGVDETRIKKLKSNSSCDNLIVSENKDTLKNNNKFYEYINRKYEDYVKYIADYNTKNDKKQLLNKLKPYPFNSPKSIKPSNKKILELYKIYNPNQKIMNSNIINEKERKDEKNKRLKKVYSEIYNIKYSNNLHRLSKINNSIRINNEIHSLNINRNENIGDSYFENYTNEENRVKDYKPIPRYKLCPIKNINNS